ncbi:cation:proton antiporter [Candidatus Micrarchaeota archaeon]|nr:cation:proton antiporter [Candidatus Micrarchaeota archaeon]
MAGGELVVGALGALIAIGILGSLFFRRTGVNDVMLLILLGIAIGPIAGVVDAKSIEPLVPSIGSIALLMVVFSEGLNLSFENLRDNAFDVLLLGAMCFALAFGASFGILHLAFGWGILDALLMAAILCASAPEIIAIVVEEMKMSGKLRQIAKLEAVLADSAAVIVAFSLLGLVGAQEMDIEPQQIAYGAAIVALLSVALGAVCALVWHFLISAAYKKYAHLGALAIACFLFAASGAWGANGVLAVFSFGFFIGNRKGEESLRLFQDEFSFLIRTFFFVYLGMLFAPEQFANTSVLLIGLSLSLAIAIARKIAVGAFSFFQRAAREDRVLSSLVQRGLLCSPQTCFQR